MRTHETPMQCKSHKRERLTGDQLLDSTGNPIDPGDALPISPALLVPTMLMQRELDYLHYLASQVHGDGRIIELGCFLGGSTRPLMIGFRNHHPNPSNLIVYDAFIAPDQCSFDADPQLATFGLAADEDFLPLYQTLHKDYLDAITIRKGFIPSSVKDQPANDLYPENEPIALLFVDAAKSWGVHNTIASVFYPHLQPDSIVVHQDFGDFRTPWILIHMYQMRDSFEPLDNIRLTSTLSFRCIQSPNELASLSQNPIDFDSSIESDDWNSIIEYWSHYLDEDATGLIAGYRATHALHAKNPASTIHHAIIHDQWRSSSLAMGHFVSPDWRQWIDRLPVYLTNMNAPAKLVWQANTLRQTHAMYDRIATPANVLETWKTDAIKSHRWEQIEHQLIEQRIDSVILLGGGRHTRWLLDSCWSHPPVQIRCIVDENPSADHINDIPLLRPDQLDASQLSGCVVLPSSDAYESHLIERARTIEAFQGLQVWKIYTSSQSESSTHDDIARTQLQTESTPTQFRSLDPTTIDPQPTHRVSLGLDPRRLWINQLVSLKGWPSWAKGHVNERDSAFIWDLIEAVAQSTHQPIHMMGINTASGVSTAIIARGLDTLAHPRSTIDAFDILEYCYFDPSRKVGEAAALLAPDLSDQIRIHHHCNARDACKQFAPAELHLAFIDADHRHPATSLDLLAVLPALTPGAWVILHDIELDLIQSNQPNDPGSQSGPHQLFEKWPYAKVRESCADLRHSNIGAIQMPSDPLSVRRFLIELIG